MVIHGSEKCSELEHFWDSLQYICPSVHMLYNKLQVCRPWCQCPCYVLLWRGQQGASKRQAVGPLPDLLARAVPDAIVLVHHLLQQCLVVGVEWRHRDVPHSTELTTVIQVLVLQTEEVPHKTPDGKKVREMNLTWKRAYCPKRCNLLILNHSAAAFSKNLYTYFVKVWALSCS